MIKTVIKRDGSKEDFSPNKINGWGEWASETLGDMVDWSDVVLQTVSRMKEEVTTNKLQSELIRTCLDMNTWSYFKMAGRLYLNQYRKELYGSVIPPSVKDLQLMMNKEGLMKPLNYSDEEYQQIEGMIDHDRDLLKPHFSLVFIREKYALKDRTKENPKEWETPQFVYIRMAMALAEDQPDERKMCDVQAWYDQFSLHKGSAPTNNFINLGTYNTGLASCCAVMAGDNLMSLSIADHVATVMTGQSAGIGDKKVTRSLKDPIRGGLIDHQGTTPYLKVLESSVNANKQGSRGGAATTYIEMFDPDIEAKIPLKNPMSTEDAKIDEIDYAFQSNRLFARKVAKDEKIFLFNQYTAPDLWEAMYEPDLGNRFSELYYKYEVDETFTKKYVSARELLIKWQTEAFETNRAYEFNIDEANHHTPFLDKIFQSNLCLELATPTKPYYNMMDLYSTEPHERGEVSICTIGAINVGEDLSDEEYEEVAYYQLLMADKCIHISSYPLPHVGVTAKYRMNAGIGIMGLAELMAKKGLSYLTQEGLNYLHYVYERHAYFLIKASLKLGKELGNAPWINKTKWPEGWLPIDTYNKNVDSLVTINNHYNWESLREEIIENGGVRNSSIIMHMPGESSSKALGTTNGPYQIRDNTLNKTSGDTTIYWAAPYSDTLNYEKVWFSTIKEQTNHYAIAQKWTDQTISADSYRLIPLGDKVGSAEMISNYLYRMKMGQKTRYYMNTTDTVNEVCENCTA